MLHACRLSLVWLALPTASPIHNHIKPNFGHGQSVVGLRRILLQITWPANRAFGFLLGTGQQQKRARICVSAYWILGIPATLTLGFACRARACGSECCWSDLRSNSPSTRGMRDPKKTCGQAYQLEASSTLRIKCRPGRHVNIRRMQ